MHPMQRVHRMHFGLALIFSGSMLAGCATPTAGPPGYIAMPPATVGDARGGRSVSVPPLPERLKFLALQEWTLWGRARWNPAANTFERPAAEAPKTEDLPEATSRVLHYWFSFKGRDFQAERALFADGSLQPWSAVFVSYLMKTAGVGAERFPQHEGHWTYIRAILDAPSANGFEALDAAANAPAVGDVLCAPRDAAAARFTSFAELSALTRQERARPYPYHCDLVVDITPTEAGLVGGNIAESVVWTRVAVDARGIVQPTQQRPWLVLLRNHLR